MAYISGRDPFLSASWTILAVLVDKVWAWAYMGYNYDSIYDQPVPCQWVIPNIYIMYSDSTMNPNICHNVAIYLIGGALGRVHS